MEPDNERAARSAANRQTSPALDLSAALTAALGRAQPMELRPEDAKLLAGMETFRFGPDDSRQAWSVGQGPVVILVHGYSGRGTQMAVLARQVAALGYQCVFFDAGGHGSSEQEKVGFFTFMHDTRDLVRHLDRPIHTIIGHSAGGLALMRARAFFGFTAENYVLISAPLFPYPPLDAMRQRGAPEEALFFVKAVLSDQFRMDWSDLSQGGAFALEKGCRLLAIYDRADNRIWHGDADSIAAIWPDAQVLKTDGYGHNRILQAPETLARVCEFIGRPLDRAESPAVRAHL